MSPLRHPGLALLLALLTLPLAPGASAGTGPACAKDALVCPPAHDVVATCRAAGLAVVGPAPGVSQAEAVVTASVPKGVGYREERASTHGPVDFETTVGDVHIAVRGVEVSCAAAFWRSAPTSNQQRFAGSTASVSRVTITAPGATLDIQGLYVDGYVYDPSWGHRKGAGCMWARTGVFVADLVSRLTCPIGLAHVPVGEARVGFAPTWFDLGGADPTLQVQGLAALRISVPTEQGEVHVYVGAGTSAIEPFPLPGPR